jgi:hypothetical protein
MNASRRTANPRTLRHVSRHRRLTTKLIPTLLLSSSTILVGTQAAADDAIPGVAVLCDNCSSFDQLQARALSYFQQWKHQTPSGYPVGKKVRPCVISTWNTQLGEPVESYFPSCTTAVVTSRAYPLSGRFTFSGIYDGAIQVGAHTASNAAVKDFDARAYARSADMPPLEIPQEFDHNKARFLSPGTDSHPYRWESFSGIGTTTAKLTGSTGSTSTHHHY